MELTRFEFWQRWLFGVTLFFIALGIALALFPGNPIFEIWNQAAAKVFFGGAMPQEAVAFQSFLFGPLGGTMAGSYLLQAFIVWGPFKQREKWAWHAVWWSMLLWFLVDSAMSIHHGAWFNVWMTNLFPVALIGLPLAMTYRFFQANDE